MYCDNCGKEIDDKAEICPKCGVRVSAPKTGNVGITKKLGHIGIPGFRSEKKWKMTIATFGYFLIFIILLAMISGPPSNQEQSKKIDIYNTPNKKMDNYVPMYTSIPTPESTPTENLLIEYNIQTVDKFVYIGNDYTYPKSGNTFVVVTVKVTNNGQKAIKTNWLDWDMSVSTTDNPNAYIKVGIVISAISSQDSGIIYPDAELETGGYIIGQVPFEVPANFDGYKITYNRNRDINIEWKKDPTLTKPIKQ